MREEPRIEDIKRLYLDEKLPVGEVAKRLGFSFTAIRSRMRENGIQLRSLGESQSLRFARKRGEIPLDDVLYLYFHEKHGICMIATKYKCAYTHIKAMIEGAGYQVRSQSEANSLSYRKRRVVLSAEEKDEVIRLYTVEELSAAEVGRKIRVSPNIVKRFLKSQNIRIRPSQFYRKSREEKRHYPILTAPPTVEKLDATEINTEKVHELRYVEGRSLAEIAEMAGLSTVEVYSILGGK